MAIDRRRPTAARDTWFAQQLGDGWTSTGDGIYYPPEPRRDLPEPAPALEAAVAAPEYRLPQRRSELMRLRERLVERVGRFPNPVTERQLREIEQELGALVRRLGPFRVARQS